MPRYMYNMYPRPFYRPRVLWNASEKHTYNTSPGMMKLLSAKINDQLILTSKPHSNCQFVDSQHHGIAMKRIQLHNLNLKTSCERKTKMKSGIFFDRPQRAMTWHPETWRPGKGYLKRFGTPAEYENLGWINFLELLHRFPSRDKISNDLFRLLHSRA